MTNSFNFKRVERFVTEASSTLGAHRITSVEVLSCMTEHGATK